MARRRSELVKADDSDTELLPLVPEEHTGAVVVQRGSEVIEGGGLPAVRPEDILAEPPDARDISAELAAPPRRALPWLTLALSACIVAAGAFIGGVYVEKHHAKGSSSGNPFAAAGNARSGADATAGTGGRGFGFGGTGTGTSAGTGTGTGQGAGGGLTFGTVKLVDGDTIYLTDAQGNTVKVTTSGSTKVTESKEGKVSDLKAGQTVTVRGTTDSSGNLSATTVTEGATLPTGFGGGFGFGGGGGAGGGAGGATGGTGGGN